MSDVCIYTLTDPITNQVRYVGKTINLTRRLYLHRYESNTSKTRKANWLKGLYFNGVEPIVDVVDVVADDEWGFWEMYWITQFRSWGFDLCNHTSGGDGVKIWTAEMREQMSRKKKGCVVWNKGIPMSTETKVRSSIVHKGQISAFKGKNHTDEFKVNKSLMMIEYFKNNVHGRLGKAHTSESIELMKKNSVGKGNIPIQQFSIDGQHIKNWDSAKSAAIAMQLVPGNITACCRKRIKHCGGYIWNYKISKDVESN